MTINFDPIVTIADRNRPPGCSEPVLNEATLQRVVGFVRDRVEAIRSGDRARIDATYHSWGLESRDYSIARGDHERTSYYDWYMNRLERGFQSDVQEIHIVPVEDPDLLPFRRNVTWVEHPDLDLQIRTAEGDTSWLVATEEGRFVVVLPNFSDAPWKKPILETAGGVVEFDAEAFAKEIAERLGLEFSIWSERLNGLVKVRAFALNVDPSEGMIEPCLLTDREDFDPASIGKWCLGEWRFYNFTSSPESSWPYGEPLCELIHRYTRDRPSDHVHPKFDYWVQPREDFEVVIACAVAFREPEFLVNLRRFDLTDDFELGVFHHHDENCECNFVIAENQNLSVLVREKGE